MHIHISIDLQGLASPIPVFELVGVFISEIGVMNIDRPGCFGVISFMESEKCGDFHLKLAETCGLFITYILYPTNSNYLAISGHFLSLPWGLRWIGLTMHPAWRHEGFRIPAKTFKRRRQGARAAVGLPMESWTCSIVTPSLEITSSQV